MIKKNFDSDDLFLVPTFEKIVSILPKQHIIESKNNGSYFDFHIKTKDVIIVPKKMNFTLKYFHLIKEYDSVYWEKLLIGWSKSLPKMFGNPLDEISIKRATEKFDEIYLQDYYNIMPEILDVNEDFITFKNIEMECEDVQLNLKSAKKFHDLYEKTFCHAWNDYVNIFLFPVNDLCFYGVKEEKLILKYPKWNSFRWSIEIPKFIINTKMMNKVIKFKSFDVEKEQVSIRMMNGMPNKELFL